MHTRPKTKNLTAAQTNQKNTRKEASKRASSRLPKPCFLCLIACLLSQLPLVNLLALSSFRVCVASLKVWLSGVDNSQAFRKRVISNNSGSARQKAAAVSKFEFIKRSGAPLLGQKKRAPSMFWLGISVCSTASLAQLVRA